MMEMLSEICSIEMIHPGYLVLDLADRVGETSEVMFCYLVKDLKYLIFNQFEPLFKSESVKKEKYLTTSAWEEGCQAAFMLQTDIKIRNQKISLFYSWINVQSWCVCSSCETLVITLNSINEIKKTVEEIWAHSLQFVLVSLRFLLKSSSVFSSFINKTSHISFFVI